MSLLRSLKTEKEAKKLSIKVWRWLYNNPDKSKWDLPIKIKTELSVFCEIKIYYVADGTCPLCDLFFNVKGCSGCPLRIDGENCFDEGSLFKNWLVGIDCKENAKKILERIKEWEI